MKEREALLADLDTLTVVVDQQRDTIVLLVSSNERLARKSPLYLILVMIIGILVG